MEIIEEECESEKENIDVDESLCRIEETRPPATTSIGVQTDLCMEDIEELELLNDRRNQRTLFFQKLGSKLTMKGLNFILV